MRRFGAGARDERGGVMPFVALTIGLVVLGASFAVDLGWMTNVTRDMQKVADLAALDAAWQLDGSDHDTVAPLAEAAAAESAQRNGHTAPDDELQVTVGDWDPSTLTFTPTSGTDVPDAVRVAATTVHHNFLQPGSGELSRTAVATRDSAAGSSTSTSTSSSTTSTTTVTTTPDEARFKAGSRLASVSTYEAELLDDIFSDAFEGGVDLTAVDYEGVANATLTMPEIGAQLDTPLGTPSEVAGATVTVDELLTAMASALQAQGDAAAASVVSDMVTASGAVGGAAITIGDVLGVDAGGDSEAAAAETDALGILQGVAFVADGDSFINMPSLLLSLPGVSSVTAGLRVIEGPVSTRGPVGTVLSTSQLVLELDPVVDYDLSYLGAGLSATGTMGVDVELAGLVATLTGLPCGGGNQGHIDADPRAALATVTSDLTVEQTVLGITSALLEMTVEGSTTSDPDPTPLSWLIRDELGLERSVGSKTAGLDSLSLSVTSSTVLGVLPLPQSSITTAVVNELSATLAGIDTAAVAQLSDMLGIFFTGGDLTIQEYWQCTTSPGGGSGGSGGGSSGGGGSSSFGIPELVA